MEQLLRVPRVAKLLDVSKKRIYNLIQEGKLEAINLGVRQTRITRESFEAYIERLRRRCRVELGLEEDNLDDPFFPAEKKSTQEPRTGDQEQRTMKNGQRTTGNTECEPIGIK